MIWCCGQLTPSGILRDRALLPSTDQRGSGTVLSIRDLLQGLHQKFQRRILQNDAVSTGRGDLTNSLSSTDALNKPPRGNTLGVNDAEHFQPGQAGIETYRMAISGLNSECFDAASYRHGHTQQV